MEQKDILRRNLLSSEELWVNFEFVRNVLTSLIQFFKDASSSFLSVLHAEGIF